MDPVTLFNRSLVDVTKYASPPEYHPDSFFQNTYIPPKPVAGSVSGLQLVNSITRPIDLVQKLGQDFSSRATAWESDWSTLTGDDHTHRFNPVVDSAKSFAGYLVIGHFGTTNGDRILVQKAFAGNNGSLSPSLNRGAAAYVVNDVNSWTSGGVWTRFSSSEQIYTVATSTDGRILLELGYDTIGLESEDPVMDLIMLVDGVELGSMAIKSVIPKLGRKAWGMAVRALTFALGRAAREETPRVVTRLLETARDLLGRNPKRAYEVLTKRTVFRHTLTADIPEASYAQIEKGGSLKISTGAKAHFGDGVYAWEPGASGVSTYIDIEVAAGTGVERLNFGGDERWVRLLAPEGDAVSVKIVGTNLTPNQIQRGRKLIGP